MTTQTDNIQTDKMTFEGVQCLRFLAAFVVVIIHSTFYAGRLDPSIDVWHRGATGVDIFFVISGFVMYVSSKSLTDRTDGWRTFAMRRIVRIVPLYWLLTTVSVGVALAVPALVQNGDLSLAYIIKSYLFIPAEAAPGHYEPVMGVGWTLNFEAFFYAIFALALLLRTNIVATVSAVLIPCVILSFFKTPEWPDFAFYFKLETLEFLAGILIARYASRGTIPWPAAASALVIGLVSILFIPWPVFPGSQIFIVLSAALIVWATVMLERPMQGRWPRALMFLGGASYSLYLIHSMVGPFAPKILSILGVQSGIVSILLSLTLSLIAAVICYVMVERPMTRFLSRLTGRKNVQNEVSVAKV
ncbi:MAG: acyltransferase family protein [Brevundimonas sp.]